MNIYEKEVQDNATGSEKVVDLPIGSTYIINKEGIYIFILYHVKYILRFVPVSNLNLVNEIETQNNVDQL